MGIVNCVSLSTVQQYYTTHLSLANGVMTSGWAVGLLFFSPVNEALVTSVGFNLFYILGGIFSFSLLTAPVYYYADSHMKLLKNDHSLTERSKLKTHSEVDNTEDKYKGLNSAKQSAESGRFSNISFLLILGSFISFIVSVNILLVYIPSRAQQIPELSAADASLLLTYNGVAELASRFLLSWTGDVFFTASLFCCTASIALIGVLALLFFIWDTFTLLTVYCCISGVVSGTVCYSCTVPTSHINAVDEILHLHCT